MYKIVGGDRKEYGPVSADQVRQWFTEGRANGDTLVQGADGIWKKLSTYAEFADLLKPTPGAIPPSFAVQAELRPALDDPRRRVQGPGISLIALGVLGLCMGLLGLLSHLFGWAMLPMESLGEPEMDRMIKFFAGGVGIIAYVVGLGFSALVLWGGLRMLSLRSYGLCITAAIIALVPCFSPCCCVGVPIGIWALVALSKPEVKAAFA